VSAANLFTLKKTHATECLISQGMDPRAWRLLSLATVAWTKSFLLLSFKQKFSLKMVFM